MKKYIIALVILFASTQAHAASQADAFAMQGQNQYQGQGQTQTSNAVVSQSGNSAVVFSDSFNGAKPIRSLPIPTQVEISTRGGAAMFAAPSRDQGPNFISVQDLVALLNVTDIGQVDDDYEDVAVIVQRLQTAQPAALATDERVTFSVISKEKTYPKGFTPLAIINLRTDEDEVTSAQLIAALTKNARDLGGNQIIFIREGIKTELSSFGGGLGLSGVYASVGSDLSDNGSTGAGGTGISFAWAKYLKTPYLSAVIGSM